MDMYERQVNKIRTEQERWKNTEAKGISMQCDNGAEYEGAKLDIIVQITAQLLNIQGHIHLNKMT